MDGQRAKKGILEFSCPRCGSKDTRSQRKPTGNRSTISCRPCGYIGHWREFFEGQEQRKAVQEKFAKGDIGFDMRYYKI